jgi:hypothetical protein
MKWKVAVSGIALVIAVPAMVLAAVHIANANSSTWTPTADQAKVAMTVAHKVADRLPPGGAAGAQTDQPTGWPTYVESVSYAASTRQQAGEFVNSSTPGDSTPVVIVRLTGHFEMTMVSTFGPSSPTSIDARVITVVADATTGAVLDTGATLSDAEAVPDHEGLTTVYRAVS